MLVIPKDSIAYLPGWFAFDFESGCTGVFAIFDAAKSTSGSCRQADCICAGEGKRVGIFVDPDRAWGVNSVDFVWFVFARGRVVLIQL